MNHHFLKLTLHVQLFSTWYTEESAPGTKWNQIKGMVRPTVQLFPNPVWCIPFFFHYGSKYDILTSFFNSWVEESIFLCFISSYQYMYSKLEFVYFCVYVKFLGLLIYKISFAPEYFSWITSVQGTLGKGKNANLIFLKSFHLLLS